MRLAIRVLLCTVSLLMVWMSGCRNEIRTAPIPADVIRVDHTVPSAPCQITVLNGSRAAHSLRLLTEDGKVLLDVDVPSQFNCLPPVWRTFNADIAGRVLTVAIDGHTKDFTLRKDTVELVIDLGVPLEKDDCVTQDSEQRGWM